MVKLEVDSQALVGFLPFMVTEGLTLILELVHSFENLDRGLILVFQFRVEL